MAKYETIIIGEFEQVVAHGRDVFISAIGAGGGQGIIFSYSLGAEEDMVDIVKQCIQRIK